MINLDSKGDVLIIGGTGFVGRHLVKRLVKNGVKVVVVANSGFDNLVEYENNIEIVQADITKPDFIDINKFTINRVIHLAGIVGEQNCSMDIANTNNVNVNGTINVINILKTTRIKKFILLSTANVYDLSNQMPVNERGAILGDGIYNSTKIAGEFIVSGYCNKMKIPFNILRGSQLYGPYQPLGTVISDIIGQLLKASLLKIKDSSVIIDLTYISDMTNAILLMLESKNDGVYNVSSGTPNKIIKIAETVSKLLGKYDEIKILHGKNNILQDTSCWLDNSKLRSLGWKPSISLFEGLKKTIKYFNKIEPMYIDDQNL